MKADKAVFDKENLGAKFGKHYFLYLNFCKSKAGYSGVAIASKYKVFKGLNLFQWNVILVLTNMIKKGEHLQLNMKSFI